jgi:hypothetical protein
MEDACPGSGSAAGSGAQALVIGCRGCSEVGVEWQIELLRAFVLEARERRRDALE